MIEEVNKAVEILKKGGVILYPTDTIWGLGCDATNTSAVKKVYEIKNRKDTKSMIILINNINMVYSYVDNPPSVALDIAEMSLKPTTIIYPRAKNMSENLIANDGSIGIRIVNDKFCNLLIQKFKKPVVSSSANISENPSPKCFDEITDYIKEKADFIVNLNKKEGKSRASCIIKIGSKNEVEIIRK